MGLTIVQKEAIIYFGIHWVNSHHQVKDWNYINHIDDGENDTGGYIESKWYDLAN